MEFYFLNINIGIKNYFYNFERKELTMNLDG